MDKEQMFPSEHNANKIISHNATSEADNRAQTNRFPEKSLLSFMRPGHFSSWLAPAALCFLFPLFTSTSSGETDITDSPLGKRARRGDSCEFFYQWEESIPDTGGWGVCQGVRCGGWRLGAAVYEALLQSYANPCPQRLCTVLPQSLSLKAHRHSN